MIEFIELTDSTWPVWLFVPPGSLRCMRLPIRIGAEFHIPPGVANSSMLAPVMEFNKLGNLERLVSLIEGRQMEKLADYPKVFERIPDAEP